MTLVLRSENDLEIEAQIPSVGVNSFDFDKIGNSPRPAVSQ